MKAGKSGLSVLAILVLAIVFVAIIITVIWPSVSFTAAIIMGAAIVLLGGATLTWATGG